MSIFLLVAMTACGGGGSNSSSNGKKTINALFMKQAGYSEKDIRAITTKFEKANPNIKVKLTFVPYESLEQKIQTSARSGGYDVVLSDAPWTAKFAKAGLVKDISNKLTSDMKQDIFQGAIDSVSYKNKIYGMPWLNDTKFLFYNKEMLKKAGISAPPKTWNEVMADSKIIKQKGIVDYPLVWSWSQAEALICDDVVLNSSFGGGLVNKNGKPTVNSTENVKALQFMVNSLKSGISNPKSTQYLEEDVRGVFSSGKAAFALNWTYMYNLANDPKQSKVNGNVGIMPVPGANGHPGYSVNGGMGLSITKGSQNADAAWKYIKYLSSKSVQKQYAKNALPIWKSLYDDPKVKNTNPAVVAASKEQYSRIANRPIVPWYGELSTKLQVALQKALLDKTSPQNALDGIQKQAEKLAK